MNQAESLLARETELDWLSAQVESGAPLLSVIGPPGVGKTALVRHWLNGRHDEDRDVVWCRVTGSAEATLDEQVARTMGLPTLNSRQMVLGALAEGPRLLVLDNLESALPDASARVARWLDRAPELQVLCTSRQPLALPEEACLSLPPLAVKGAANRPSPAAALFMARSGEASPLPEVEALVRYLDGLPLSIELMAARTPVLGPKEMLTLLRDGAGSGSRHLVDILARAVDSSYGSLDKREQAGYRALSVLRGPFRREAAAAVTGLGEAETLALLETLYRRSLLTVQPGPPRRYAYLEMIRHDASRHLGASGEQELVEARHAAYFASVARALGGPEAAVDYGALAGMRRTRADVLAALKWSLTRADRLSDAVACATGLVHLSRVGEDLADVDAGLEAVGERVERDGSDAERLAILLCRYRTARRDSQPLLRWASAYASLANESGDPEAKIVARLLLSNAAARTGDMPRALEEVERAKAQAEKDGSSAIRAEAHTQLSEVARDHGDLTRARTAAARARELTDSERDPIGRVNALIASALGAVTSGDLDRTRRFAREGIEILERLGARDTRRGLVLTMADARAAHAAGDLQAAALGYARALAGAQRGGDMVMAGGATFHQIALQWQRGELRTACEAAHGMLPAIAHFDRAHAATFQAILGGMECRLGNLDEGGALVEAAVSTLEQAQAKGLLQIAEACRGFVELARARRDPEGAGKWIASASARLESMRSIPPGFEATLVVDLLSQALARPAGVGARTLRVHPDVEWFEAPPAARVLCRRRWVMRRVLQRLIEAHGQGRAVDQDALLEAGWPGQKMRPHSGRHRVHVMLGRMRDLGLREILETTESGYRIAPACTVEVARD